MDGDGNGWVRCGLGHRHWGRHGAAGLLIVRPDPVDPRQAAVLLQHRSVWTSFGDTWGIPGGARDSHETAAQAALREAAEEAGIAPATVVLESEFTDDHGGWAYVTVIARAAAQIVPRANAESAELRWVRLPGVTDLSLHPGFAATWPLLRDRLDG